jgi:hypothetical protein
MPIGTKIYTTEGSGLDSNKKGVVCAHFTNSDGYEMSLKMNSDWVPVQFENGNKTYMPESHLLEVDKKYKTTIENEVIVHTEL